MPVLWFTEVFFCLYLAVVDPIRTQLPLILLDLVEQSRASGLDARTRKTSTTTSSPIQERCPCTSLRTVEIRLTKVRPRTGRYTEVHVKFP